ncbi:hypothetical protein [Desulforhopalus sp. 52FAK]
MEQYTENQYDDDLTDSSGEYDDSYYTGAEDLFDYTPDEESPISRLKSLVLSIDWEITDDVLMEFNEELLDLKDIWAGEKINLVYVQALEKLSKYIYQKKAESHPSAIKLLLTLYHNLEKIVTSDDLSAGEKKSILLEDVKRFEDLKSHLKTPGKKVSAVAPRTVVEEVASGALAGGESELINLKAIVLGIDWEITDDDLSALRKEVVRLETLFAGSRPKLILLQGLGTIGAYIKVKKSDSHADAFKVLHLFYDSLEKIVDSPMSVDEEKAILFPAVERFNEFKSLLGETISPEKINRRNENQDGDAPGQSAGSLTPAFSDLPEDDVMGFQADKEAAALGIENPDNVNDHVANFFGEDSFVDEREPTEQLAAQMESQFGGSDSGDIEVVDKSTALQGVDVEEGDEEDEEDVAVLHSDEGDVSPALSFDDDSLTDSPISEEANELVASDFAEESVQIEDDPIQVTFPDDGEDEVVADFSSIDKSFALQGVDVESEADDDSDEEALPVLEGELAPALADNDEVSLFNAEKLDQVIESDGLEDEISDTVLDFFEEEQSVEKTEFDSDEISDEGPLELDEDLSFEPDLSTTSEIEEEAGPISDSLEALQDSTPAEPPVSYDEFDLAGQESSSAIAEEKSEDDISTDIEGQLDDFFGSDDFGSEDSANDMFPSMGLDADDSTGVAVDIEDSIDEEVVFELVEESLETEHKEINELAGVAAVGGIASLSDGADPVVEPLDVPDIEPSVDATSETDSVVVDTVCDLDGLASCIEAAGLELEDNVLSGLLDELQMLDEKFVGQPLDRTFVSLLRSVATHIDRYRYEAGSSAYELLKSVYDALALSQKETDKKENLILSETVKVLAWQQEIISNDSRKTADSAKMAAPLFVQELGNPSDEVMTFEDDVLNDIEAEQSPGGSGEPPVNIKDEISSLRKSLQDEISELKKGREEG